MNMLKKLFLIALIQITITPLFGFQTDKNLPPEFPKLKSNAQILMNEGMWEEAIAAYTDLQNKCISQGSNALSIDLYEEILAVIVIRDDMEPSDKLTLFNQYKSKVSAPKFTGIYLSAIAQFYAFYGELDSMDYYYNQAIRLCQKNDYPSVEGNLNIALAFEFYMVDDIQTGLVYLERAEKILNEKLIPNNIDLPNIYNTQTLIYEGLGMLDKALNGNLKSIELLEADSNAYILDIIYEYNNLASIYSALKDYSNSLNYYQKALSFAERIPDFPKYESATLIYNIGATHIDQNNFKKAKQASLKSLQFLEAEVPSEKTDDKSILGDYINNYHQLVRCYNKFGELDSALFYLKKAEIINQKFPYRLSATYFNYSKVFVKKNELEKAQKYANLALNQATKVYGKVNGTVGTSYQILSNIALKRNDLIKALFYIQKSLRAISLDFSDDTGFSNPDIQSVQYKGELLNLLKTKIKIIQKLYVLENSTVDPKDIFSTAKLATTALELLNRNIRDVESKSWWLDEEAIPLFESAIDLALNVANKTGNKQYLNEAFMLSERSKSMLMTDVFAEDNASNFGGVPDSLIEKSNELEKNLALAEKKRFDARMAGDTENEAIQKNLIFQYGKELDLLKHLFESQYPEYYELKFTSNVASIEQIQAILDDETTFIEYFQGAVNIYAFAITKNDVQVDIIKRKKNYITSIFKFQSKLSNFKNFKNNPTKVYNSFVLSAHNFYKDFIKNSLSKNNTSRLIIVPDGQLGYIPFEVLLTEAVPDVLQGEKKENFATLPYLLKNYKISYNYSGTLLLSQKAKHKQVINGNILAMAPSYTQKNAPEWRGPREVELRKTLIELPGAEEEVLKLEQLFSGDFYLGKEANEANFKNKASNFGILHLAMHGLVSHDNPEFSGLALTEEMNKKEDNFLYAYEIKQLALNVGLVVLSACETGIGKYQRGEGVVSLGRGFMYAGAPSLMMTLWSLHDQSGAVIIEEFYKNLSQGINKDESLRKAKMYYLENCPLAYAHPSMWAAFVQVGDYSSIDVSPKSNSKLVLVIIGGIILFLLGFYLLKRKNR